MKKVKLLSVLLCASAITLAGCNGGGDTSSAPEGSTSAPSSEPSTSVEPVVADWSEEIKADMRELLNGTVLPYVSGTWKASKNGPQLVLQSRDVEVPSIKEVFVAAKYKAEDQDIYYNDYACDYNVDNCTFALNGFLKQAVDEHLVDGFGIQGHIDTANIRHVINVAKLIKEKGLKCQITELDITTTNSEQGFAEQKAAYKDLVSELLDLNAKGETNVNAIVVWGITDDTSWKRGQEPLLLTSSYKKKPAYYGFLEALTEYQNQSN